MVVSPLFSPPVCTHLGRREAEGRRRCAPCACACRPSLSFRPPPPHPQPARCVKNYTEKRAVPPFPCRFSSVCVAVLSVCVCRVVFMSCLRGRLSAVSSFLCLCRCALTHTPHNKITTHGAARARCRAQLRGPGRRRLVRRRRLRRHLVGRRQRGPLGARRPWRGPGRQPGLPGRAAGGEGQTGAGTRERERGCVCVLVSACLPSLTAALLPSQFVHRKWRPGT